MLWRKRSGKELSNFVFFVLAGMLVVYAALIFFVNFSKNPELFCSDMYSDMLFASEVWAEKTIFPDGWVFGNQVYVVATPVLAALFYGITANHWLSMSLASSVMGVFVVLSFDWLLTSVVKSKTARLAGIVAFVSLVLLLGDAVYMLNGWQLFFTLCSYYACYAITAFLSFGCYVRGASVFSRKQLWILCLSCFLSFGTGIQSLRQTAVMALPLCVIEGISVIIRLTKKEKPLTKASLVAAMLVVANVAGVLLFRALDIPQVEIFGQISLIKHTEFFSSFADSLRNVRSLFSGLYSFVNAKLLLAALLVAVVLASIIIVRISKQNASILLCYSLFITSILVIFGIDTFTTMNVRDIYYFMIYPLMAFVAACLFFFGGRTLRMLVLSALVIIFALSCSLRLPDTYDAVMHDTDDGYEEVSNYLQENGYTTVYAGWNCGEKIAMASDFEIQVGFWPLSKKPFVPVKYLCNPDVFIADSSQCAYVFFGAESVERGLQAAKDRSLTLNFLKYFPQSDIYVFTSPINIMQLDLQE